MVVMKLVKLHGKLALKLLAQFLDCSMAFFFFLNGLLVASHIKYKKCILYRNC